MKLPIPGRAVQAVPGAPINVSVPIIAQTAPLDPISQDSWSTLTLLEINRILGHDGPPRGLPAFARALMIELNGYRAAKK